MEKITTKLPEAFLRKMKTLLGDNFEKYIKAVDEEPVRGLRVNTKRISANDFASNFSEDIEPIAFASDGFILKSEEKIGNSASHLSGIVYLQEPSSMLAVCSSGIEDEQRPLKVLDLCASPGGKSGQIAARISADSVLFSNEIISSRAGILNSNIERLGFKNVIVLNEKPENLLVFENYFDYVFVDAPCSGEGMFRKNPETIGEWSEENVLMCADRQKDILEVAQRLVASGGKLVYSTCTYSKEEDENIIEWMLDKFNYELVDVPESVKNLTIPSTAKVKHPDFARKFLPFSGKGEGQFVAVFKNLDDDRENKLYTKKHFRAVNEIGRTWRNLVDAFLEENTSFKISRRPLVVSNNVYLIPENMEVKVQTALDELKFVNLGVKMGTIEKERFEPNHNLFMAYPEVFNNKIELDDDGLKKYLHGEELFVQTTAKGYGVVTKNGYPIGGVKIVGGRLKNLYPKGLRV